MWTNENRAKYKRDHLRYPSDVTDEEWAHVEPLIPRQARRSQARSRHAGGVQRHHVRAEHGMPMALYSQDLPPRSTVYHYFCRLGSGTARWIAFMTRSTRSVANRRNAKPVPPPPSSTARA